MKRASVVVGLAILLGVLSTPAAVAGCLGGMDVEDVLADEAIAGVTERTVFSHRVGLRIWAEGSVSAVTAVWGEPPAQLGLSSHGGRFNVIPEGEDNCDGFWPLESRIYELVYADDVPGGPYRYAAVSAADLDRLTERFGPPERHTIGGGDRFQAAFSLWFGPGVTFVAFVTSALGAWYLVVRRRTAVKISESADHRSVDPSGDGVERGGDETTVDSPA